MYQNEKDFEQKYDAAMVRVGLGMYIIDQIFKQHGKPHANTRVLEDKESCVRAWASVLADGLEIPVDGVIVDAKEKYSKFTAVFINSANTQRSIQVLVQQLAIIGALPRQ